MTIVDSSARLVGLIGHPIAHSLSPAMHNAAFAELKLNFIYVPLPVRPDRPDALADAVKGLRALGFVGANITVPYKSAVIGHLDEISDAARAIGAVNTIKIDDDTIKGDNTDSNGFLSDLKDRQIDIQGANALVIGAGGSARAIVYALSKGKVERIVILARNEAQALEMTQSLSNNLKLKELFHGSMVKDLKKEIECADIAINCTPVGMDEYPQSELTANENELPFKSGQIVYDLVYNPTRTWFLRKAVERGARAIGGLGMLVRQGAESFAIWTGREAPLQTMFKAAKELLSADQE